MNEVTVADQRVHPATVAIRFLKDVPRTVIGIPAILAFTSELDWTSLAGLALAATVIIALLQWLSWRSFRYGVGLQELVIESGILSRNRRAIPFERVQDVDIERGPLARIFGLAKVKIETGGAASDEGLLDSITLAEAARIRAAIRAGQAKRAGTNPNVESTDPPSRLLFGLDARRLLLLGFFNFSLVYLAILFGILNTVEPWLPFDVYNVREWVGSLGEEQLRGLARGAPAVALLVVALLLGVVTGLVSTIARDFGFRLLDENRRFRRERGLLTRSEIVIPKERIQLALVSTGPIRRALGMGELRLQTLAADSASGGQQTVAPLARSEEMSALIAAAGRLRLPEAGGLRRVARGHVVRKSLQAAVLPLAAILAGAFWSPWVLSAILALPLLVAGAMLDRRFSGYALSDDLLFASGGIWRQRLWIIPVRNVQSLAVTTSPLQRWLGLASLSIDTAGAPGLGGARIIDLHVGTARELSDTLASRLRLTSVS